MNQLFVLCKGEGQRAVSFFRPPFSCRSVRMLLILSLKAAVSDPCHPFNCCVECARPTRGASTVCCFVVFCSPKSEHLLEHSRNQLHCPTRELPAHHVLRTPRTNAAWSTIENRPVQLEEYITCLCVFPWKVFAVTRAIDLL